MFIEKPYKIALIDDDPLILSLMQQVISIFGIKTVNFNAHLSLGILLFWVADIGNGCYGL